MKKLDVPEKSRGVLLFAFNSTINYVSIAEKCARLVEFYLKLPVTLVTDSTDTITYTFDHVILAENTMDNYKSAFDSTKWRNANRYQAYELSPYDETLLIDTDYLVLDNSLLTLFDQTVDYQIMANNQTPTDPWQLDMGNTSLPYLWATVILFKKTIKSNLLFNLVGRIQRNYNYYTKLYNIRERNFRNDYAFTIANVILNGYDIESTDTKIPWSMLTIDKDVDSMYMQNKFIIVRIQNQVHMIPTQNIHVMDKQYLLSEDFNQFVDTVCNE
jgi:hypothetical protein